MALITDPAVAADMMIELAPATDGEIAVINLKSALQASWNRFWRDPQRVGVAELIVEQEKQAAQYLGDLDAFGRLETLVNQFSRTDAESSRVALVQAQFASMTHRFAEARDQVAKAESLGAPSETISRLSLSIDQACGTHLDSVLEKRRRISAESERLEDLVPLGSLLAICANSPRPIALTGARCRSTRMCPHSLSHGSAFSLAPCGENSFPSLN